MPDALSPWVNKMMVRLPGALVAVARDELGFAISEFFRESLCWQEIVGPHTVGPDTEDLSLNPVDGRSTVIHTIGVYVDERPAPWASSSTSGLIKLKNWPTEEKELVARVALTPRDPSVWLPPVATEHYFDAILDGALGRMYLHPLKPYSSDRLATFHLTRARGRTREARDAARREFTPDAAVWRYPEFGV